VGGSHKRGGKTQVAITKDSRTGVETKGGGTLREPGDYQ
jgi:hypothetical protein